MALTILIKVWNSSLASYLVSRVLKILYSQQIQIGEKKHEIGYILKRIRNNVHQDYIIYESGGYMEAHPWRNEISVQIKSLVPVIGRWEWETFTPGICDIRDSFRYASIWRLVHLVLICSKHTNEQNPPSTSQTTLDITHASPPLSEALYKQQRWLAS